MTWLFQHGIKRSDKLRTSVLVQDTFQKLNCLLILCLLSRTSTEKSARYTFPNLLNFRVAVLPGFRRVFAHVAPVFLERGIANVVTKVCPQFYSVLDCKQIMLLLAVQVIHTPG